MPAIASEMIEECLGLIAGALIEYRYRRFDTAKRFLAAGVMHAASLPDALRADFGAALFIARCWCNPAYRLRL